PPPGELLAPQPASGPRLDWGDALDVPSIYGREQELATLARWVVQEGCRLVSVLGMGGMGKSALVVRAMQQLAGHFDVVLFRSLRDAPDCSALRALERSRTLVRALRLGGLDAAAGEQLLAEHEVRGSSQERAHLVEAYSGNPLALNIVAETIADLFGGAIDPFLAGGTVIFGG